MKAVRAEIKKINGDSEEPDDAIPGDCIDLESGSSGTNSDENTSAYSFTDEDEDALSETETSDQGGKRYSAQIYLVFSK